MLSEDNLTDDLAEILGDPSISNRWINERPNPLEFLVTMSPQSQPEEKFQLRLFWTEYPAQPPSVKFRDPATGSLTIKTAWPTATGFRPDQLDTCVNWSQEGFNTHQEWRNDPKTRWDGSGNALLRVLQNVQELLDWSYAGRAA
jgi:hypothetical protein